MIVAMKKYSFLVYHKEYIDFLKGIQDLGVLHVIEKSVGEIEDETLRQKYQSINELNSAIKFLEKRKVEEHSEPTKGDSLAIVQELKKMWAEDEANHQKIAQLRKDISLLEPWGNFDWESIIKLEETGLIAGFYTCPTRRLSAEWRENYAIAHINELSGTEYFVVFYKQGEEPAINAEQIKLPRFSLSKLKLEEKEIEGTLKKAGEIYNDYAVQYTRLLENTKNQLSAEMHFEKVVLYTQKEADNKLMFLEGWVPKDKEEELNTFLEKESIYYTCEKPGEDDKIPIKLKNNWFAKLFEPIGALYSLPAYNELDLTAFFAPFFMLFFGFCLGDIGYGLIILAATFYFKPKMSKKIRPIITLAQFLGISTIFMGLISGTFFGMDLLKTDFLFFPSLRFMMLDSNQLMKLSLIIGGTQILFGIGIRAANQIIFGGFRSALPTLGWLFIFITGGITYLLKSKGILDAEIVKPLFIGIGIIGGIPILFFNNPGKGIFFNIGLGLWDTYGMGSGLLGDLLSYIRLFALGISSAVLGNVFNQIAVDLSGKIPVVSQIVMILILLFGHSLNLSLSILGSFVHPMRLTFVEFYKNAGFAGAGLKYQPLSK